MQGRDQTAETGTVPPNDGDHDIEKGIPDENGSAGAEDGASPCIEQGKNTIAAAPSHDTTTQT